MNSVEYLRLDAAGSVLLPLLPGVAVRLRAAAGRIFPFGKGLPGNDGSPLAAFLAFRDVSFTAGGPTDVRGWSTGLLGPKFPDIRASVNGTDTTFTTEGYTPVMGLARVSLSAEVRTPMPFLGDPWGWLMMLDGARVWTPDPAFGSAEDPLGEQRFFSSLAGGIEYGTPVGSLRVTLGYKLNPSPLDVRPPEDVLRVLAENRPVEDVPADNSMRWQLHLALLVGF
jgi:outer membrane protein assembly factor BamA